MNSDSRIGQGNRSDQGHGSTGAVFLGMIFGALAGAVSALLLAPRSGKETQRVLRERGDTLRREAERRVADGRNLAGDRVRHARVTVAQWLDEGSSLLGDQADRVRDNEVEEKIAAG